MEIKQLEHIGLFVVMTLIAIASAFIYWDGINYSPIKQNVKFDLLHKLIHTQDLTDYATHENGYREGQLGVADVAMHTMMVKFTYDAEEMKSGQHRQKISEFVIPEILVDFYDKDFMALNLQKMILANDLIARSKILIPFEVADTTTEISYEGETFYTGLVRSYRVEGEILVETHGDVEVKQIYRASIIVQRAFIEDYLSGYMVTSIRLEAI